LMADHINREIKISHISQYLSLNLGTEQLIDILATLHSRT